MNWNRCSEAAIAALLVCAVLAGAATTAGAVSVSGDTPSSAQVGNQQTATYTFTDPFAGQYTQWTLQGKTDLKQATWVVTTYDNTGAQIAKSDPMNGHQFSYQLDAKKGITKVKVSLKGTVAAPSSYSYDPPQQQTLASFTQAQQGGASEAIGQPVTFRPYTPASQQARDKLDAAKSAIQRAQSAGANVGEATTLLSNAKTAFNGPHTAKGFDNAESLATQAKNKANAAASAKKRTHWLLIGAAAVVVLLVIGGAVWWYRSNQDDYDRLG